MAIVTLLCHCSCCSGYIGLLLLVASAQDTCDCYCCYCSGYMRLLLLLLLGIHAIVTAVTTGMRLYAVRCDYILCTIDAVTWVTIVIELLLRIHWIIVTASVQDICDCYCCYCSGYMRLLLLLLLRIHAIVTAATGYRDAHWCLSNDGCYFMICC